jgi:glycosyltransferase involved in cell wall biosynthesis
MANSTIPKVSVCMPVYNGSDYIADSIESVLTQTYKNFNLIVCDNCSTDNTEEIVCNFNDPRLIYVRNNKNLGLVGNHNRCLELADGEYVYFLHHDDIMLPDNLELKVRILDEHPNVGLVHSDVLFMDKNGEHLNITKFDAKRDYIEDGIKAFEKYILAMPVGARFFIGSVLARRDCYLKLGGLNPLLPNADDSEMWMRILLFYDVACVGKHLVKYRLHDGMTSASINDRDGLNLLGLEEHYLASHNVIEKYKPRISQWRNLKIRVDTGFSMKAVSRGIRLLKGGKTKESIASFKTALKFYPPVFFKKVFWTFIWKLIIKRVQRISNKIIVD